MIGQVYSVKFDKSDLLGLDLLDLVFAGGDVCQSSPGFVGWDLLGWLGRFGLLESGLFGQV